MSNISWRDILLAISGIVVLACPFLYIGNYAGDAELSLIYGQNAAHGNFFEFNLGEKSPGVTTTAWMLFIAAWFDLAPDTLVPFIIKLSTIFFWFGFLYLVFLVAKLVLSSTGWAWLALVVSGVIPGSVYNSTIGMEAALFALAVWAWIYLAVRWKWFVTSSLIDLRSELILGFLLGTICWIRPEGFVLAAIAISYRVAVTARSLSTLSSSLFKSAIFLIPFVFVAIGWFSFHFLQTGYMLPTSGFARGLMSHIAPDTYQIGPLFVSSKFAIRLAAYFPITLLWLWAIWIFARGRGVSQEMRTATGFLMIFFGAFFVLFSTLLSSVHLSRYVVFAMPALVIVGALGAKWLWESRQPTGSWLRRFAPRVTLVWLALVLGAVFSYEANLRLRSDSQASLWRVMKAPQERESLSNTLFDHVGRPEQLPISIALQEVQIRYWLDDRFVVRSLDGRTDPVLLEYATDDRFDHIGYLKERNVQFLLDTPSYNKDPDLWSLIQLNKLEPGDTIQHAGLKFTRLPVQSSNRANNLDNGPKPWIWFAGADGVSMFHWFLEDLSYGDYPELDATLIHIDQVATSE